METPDIYLQMHAMVKYNKSLLTALLMEWNYVKLNDWIK